MAQLKDLIVNGPSQFIGDAITNTIQIDKLKAKSSEFNNETYIEGNNGDILVAQSGHLYWKTPIATNGDLGFVKIGTGISSNTDGTINVTPEGLGLASAMHFRGITTTDLKNSSTSATIELKVENSSTTSHSAVAGDVVLYSATAGTGEYVWTGNSWELLGDPNSFKVKQQAVTTATSGDLGERRFVSSITQNENGEISISTSPLALANEDSSGAIKTGFSTTGQLYAVELSPTGAAYVNVPWKNTTPYGVRVYRQITSDTSWNNDYPLLVSRTTANNIGEIGNDGTYLNNVYGIINNDNTKIPTLNPHTGLIKISGGINLSGGQIKKQGESTSWHKGRDKAALAITQLNGYSVLASMSTTNGSWDIGAYNSDNFTDDLLFTYVTNTQYGGTAPNKTAQIKFLENGHIVADLDGSAEKIKITTTSLPDSGSNTYYLTYVSGTSGNQALKSSTRSYVWENKDSTYGCLGNSGILGAITLYSRSTSSNGIGYYGNLKPPSTLTNSVNWTLPDKDGTIALFENTWSLSGGTAILSAANLNSVTAPGNYYCNTNSNSKTILNNPYSTTANDSFHAFTLKVIHSTGNSATYLRQEVWEYDKNYYFIRRSTTAGASWTPWVKFDNESSFVKRNGSTAIGSTATPIFVDSNGVANSVSANNVLINLGTTASDSIYKGTPRPGVTGILSVANGGTGAKTFAANSIIMSGTTTTAPFTTRAITNNTSNVTATANTNIPTMNTLYYTLAKINYKDQTHATNIYAPITAGTANQILVSSGGTAAPIWKATAKGAVYITTANGVLTFGTLGVGYGGTGKTGWPINSVLYASASATLGAITAPTKDSALKVGAANSTPIFTSINPSVTIGAGSANTAPTINISVLGVEGTAKTLTKSTTKVYGVTKLTETYSNTNNTLAITGKGVKNALDNTYWANVKVGNSSSPDTTEPIFKNAWAGSTASTTERDIGAISQNGKIYFYSNGVANGKRGIWLADKNNSNSAGLLIVDANNEITTHATMKSNLYFRGTYNKNEIPSDDIYQGIYFRDTISTTINYMTAIRTRKDTNGNQHLQFLVSKHGTGKEGATWGTQATMSYSYPAAEGGVPTLTLPGRYISTVSSSTTKNDWSGIQFSVRDTTTENTEYAYIRAYNSHTTNGNGANLALNAASGILIGAGEGSAQVRDHLFSEEPNDIENIRLIAEDSVHIYGGASNDEISGNKNTRSGIVIDKSGHILPQKAGSSNDNQQNLGNNQNHFHNIYGNALYMTDNSQQGTRSTTWAFGMYQSGKELWFTRRQYNSTANNVYVGAPLKFDLENGQVYIGITETDATAATYCYPTFTSGKSGTNILRGSSRFYLYDYGTTNNGVWLNVGTSNYKGGVTLHSNNTHFGSMSVTASLSGDQSYILPDKTGWVPIASMAGAGSVTAPVYVSSTGSVVQVSANSVLTNLGSNSGASIYAATPRPGVTGILAIANGGTGANTAAKALDTDHLLAGINSNNLTTTLTDETIILSSSPTGFTSNYKGLYQRKLSKVKDYIQNNTYWANVKVSNSSSTSTKPTFAEATATTFHGALDGNASSATKIKITATELPSSGSNVYYLTYTSGTSGNQNLKNSGRSYIWEDQESVYASLGKAGILGGITLYSKSTSSNNASLYGNLRPTTTFTGRRTWYLPNATGWVVVGGNGSTTGVGSVSHPVYIDTNGVAKAVTLQRTQDALINSLPIGTDAPSDADYYVCQYANGGTANTAYRRRPTSALYTYIKGKIATDHLYVKRAGDIMTGNLSISNNSPYKHLYFRDIGGSLVGGMNYDSGATASISKSQIYFCEYSPKKNPDTATTGKVEYYYLPAAASGLAENKEYNILTTKNPVTIGQGGTGASSASEAMNIDHLLAGVSTSSLTATLTDNTIVFTSSTYGFTNDYKRPYQRKLLKVYQYVEDKMCDNTDKLEMARSIYSKKTSNEAQVVAQSGAGKIYLYAGGTTTSTVGIYCNNAAGNAAYVLKVTQDRKMSTGMEFTAPKVWGAVYNDYAEMRNVPEAQIENNLLKPGTCVREVGDGTMVATTERLQRGCKIISDTFGFNIGETEDCKTPIAVSGRALVYLDQDRENARNYIGWPVCSGPNGTVSIMTEEEEEKYPSRIVGIISEIPDYEKWGSSEVEVNGRIWIYVR